MITGAGGFIGSRLFNSLKKKNYKVFGIDFDFLKDNKDLIEVDLVNEKQSKNLINKINPSFVFHLAVMQDHLGMKKIPSLQENIM